MKVFISWSGDVSHRVALELRDWIPYVINAAVPYVSSEDIEAGKRWGDNLTKVLSESIFGIICLTKTNIASPWLNFEAGALSREIAKNMVCPYVYRAQIADIQGPLSLFQAAIADHEGTLKLLESMNKTIAGNSEIALEGERLRNSFELLWPRLQERLNAIVENDESDNATQTLTMDQIGRVCDELLDLSRRQLRLLQTPQELFPEGLISILRSQQVDSAYLLFRNQIRESIRTLQHRCQELFDYISTKCGKPDVCCDSDLVGGLESRLQQLNKTIRNLAMECDQK